jgi:protein-S-isoprenylcysteine O-methyltransferase Ste14
MKMMPDNHQPEIFRGIVTRLGQIVVGLVILVAVLFLGAGSLSWPWAWLFLGIYLVSVATNSIFLLRSHPETVAERGRPKEMKGWDKLISGLWSVSQFLAIPLLAGLDMRWNWSGTMDFGWHMAGGGLFVLGLAFFGWSMITNAYFSTVVRIQSDRGHGVCDRGPYRWVRHPGYVGTILQSLGAPLLLGSWWALIAGFTAAALIILRTALEDRLLQKELAGYQVYAQQVRYRILPGIW